MSRHHSDPETTFDRWAKIWLDPRFATFDIRNLLSRFTGPLLVPQGDRDEYATEEMVHGVTREVLMPPVPLFPNADISRIETSQNLGRAVR